MLNSESRHWLCLGFSVRRSDKKLTSGFVLHTEYSELTEAEDSASEVLPVCCGLALVTVRMAFLLSRAKILQVQVSRFPVSLPRV